ncbi:MAG: FtsL-like putative cell division protein [Vicingaceae bacterium]|nr:FtsL-like putative cell division protein [Vicingaceae bacterium]
MNKFKQKESTEKQEKEKKPSSPNFFVSLISGNFLAKENVVNSLPFVFYLTLLGILYIANGYNAEKLVRELDHVNDDLKELRSEYITIKSDLNYESKQSQVAEKTELFGVMESIVPPTKIMLSKKEIKSIK